MGKPENMYLHGYKCRLYPTEEQKMLINKYIDLYRRVYNWGISMEENLYQQKKEGKSTKGFYTFYQLSTIFTQYRKSDEGRWSLELPINTARRALKDVVNAYKMYFNGYNHHPHFKSKNKTYKTFKTENTRFYIDKNMVRFEGLIKGHGPKATKENGINVKYDTKLRYNQNIKYHAVCITLDHFGNYWVTYSIYEPIRSLDKPKTEPIGVDMGIRKTLTLSTGEVFIRPNNKIDKLDKRLRREQRHYTRDIKRRKLEAKLTNKQYDEIPKSTRSQKRLLKINKLKKRITNIKNNFYHETIKQIVLRNPESIAIETTNIKTLLRQHHKNNHQLFHSDFYKMACIFRDKCNTYNIPLIEASPAFKSTQICSNCGNIKHMSSQSIYVCHNCGLKIDRDYNAALNLRSLLI